MSEFHKYVPTHSQEGQLALPNGSTIEFDDTKFFQILFGGDQLTVARARGAQALRATHDTAKERLEGLCPVLEDWHARMILLKVLLHDTYYNDHATNNNTSIGNMEAVVLHKLNSRESFN